MKYILIQKKIQAAIQFNINHEKYEKVKPKIFLNLNIKSVFLFIF